MLKTTFCGNQHVYEGALLKQIKDGFGALLMITVIHCFKLYPQAIICYKLAECTMVVVILVCYPRKWESLLNLFPFCVCAIA